MSATSSAPILEADDFQPALRAQVEAMTGYGIADTDIALVMKLDPQVLRELYPEELASGHIKANAKVAENLYRKATGDGREAVTAAIFWLKTRASWKETSVAEITHDVADPVRGLMQRIAEKGARLHDRD
jgi:hypothetical protein